MIIKTLLFHIILVFSVSVTVAQNNMKYGYSYKVEHLCDSMNVDENGFYWVYSVLNEYDSYEPVHPRGNDYVYYHIDSLTRKMNLHKKAMMQMWIRIFVNCHGEVVYTYSKYGKSNFIHPPLKIIEDLVVNQDQNWKPAVVNGQSVDFYQDYYLLIKKGKLSKLSVNWKSQMPNNK